MNLWEKIRTMWNKVIQNIPAEVATKDDAIDKWFDIYKLKASWLDYKYRTVDGKTRTRRRLSMNAAKVVCQELNNLVFSEPPQLHADQFVLDILKKNNFMSNLNDLSEYVLALGGGALKLRYDSEIGIDFVKAHNFVPISWDNTRITEAAFIDKRKKEGVEYVRVETHKKTEGGYLITNELYKESRKVPLSLMFPDMEESVTIKTDVPLFSYVKPPIANNFDPESPLGVSLYANAEDTLKALDIAFDSLNSEMVLGKKRIIVPEGAVRAITGADGKPVRYFDPADEVFVALSIDEDNSLQIQDNSVELRIEEIKLAIQTLLDILSLQIGFSSGAFSFDGQQVKTATEVISDNSKTFKLKVSYEKELETGILQLMEGIRALAKNYTEVGSPSNEEYTIAWNDSVIEDRDRKSAYWVGLYASGLATLEMVLNKIYGIEGKELQTMAQEIRNGQPLGEPEEETEV